MAAQELEGEFLDSAGTLFRRHWFGVVETVPPLVRKVRAWDLAATPKDEMEARDPDWTAGVLLGKAEDGTHYVLDVRRLRGTPQHVQAVVRATAAQDGWEVAIVMEQEPGSSGVAVIDYYLCLLAGYSFRGERSTGDKVTRAQPLAAQAEGGKVKVVRGAWTKDFLDEMEAFPFGRHDDQVDAASLACWSLRFDPLHYPTSDGVPWRRSNLEPHHDGSVARCGLFGVGPPVWDRSANGTRWRPATTTPAAEVDEPPPTPFLHN
jgi:predicted phage terminase large subunit-like protein